jgi:hypothetical protein
MTNGTAARNRQADSTDDLAGLSGDLGERCDDLSERRPCALDEAPPRVREGHAARRARQKNDAQLLFELPHGLADRRPGDAELAPGAAEAAHPRNGQERLKLRKRSRIHAANGSAAGDLLSSVA